MGTQASYIQFESFPYLPFQMLSNIPAPSRADIEFIAAVTIWDKKRLEVYWNRHAGMAVFKELEDTRREIVYVIDDDTQEYVRSRAELIVENYYNMYTLENPNPAVWHECDDTMSLVTSLMYFLPSAVAQPYHLIFNNVEQVNGEDHDERGPATEFQVELLYTANWNSIATTWVGGLPNTLSLNVRSFLWLTDVHHQRAMHIVSSRRGTREHADEREIRKMAMAFRLEAAELELAKMRQELTVKEAIIQHMRDELAEE